MAGQGSLESPRFNEARAVSPGKYFETRTRVVPHLETASFNEARAVSPGKSSWAAAGADQIRTAASMRPGPFRPGNTCRTNHA